MLRRFRIVLFVFVRRRRRRARPHDHPYDQARYHASFWTREDHLAAHRGAVELGAEWHSFARVPAVDALRCADLLRAADALRAAPD